MVVDVAVQRGHDVRWRRTTGLFEFERVERVRVRLADDANARPAGVAEDRDPRRRRLQRPAEQRIVGQCPAQCRGVVAEFTDLGGSLVHERQTAAGVDDGTGLEQRVGASGGNESCQRLGLDVVAPHEDVETCGIAAAHFESIDRRERLLDREVAAEHRRRRIASGERLDLTSGSEAVVADRPGSVLEVDQFGVGVLEGVSVEVIGVRVEATLDV